MPCVGDGNAMVMTRRGFLRASALAAAAASATALAACQARLPFGGTANDIRIVDPATQRMGVALATIPTDLDPARATTMDAMSLACHLFSGLARWQEDDGVLSIVPDCATTLPDPVDNGDGTWTYSYDLRWDAAWSDGVPVSAGDFEYAWRRAASGREGAPCRYLFSDVVGYDEGGSIDDDGSGLAVHAVGERTLEVTLRARLPYWEELLAHPAFFPLRREAVEASAQWASSGEPPVTCGRYSVSSWVPGESVELEWSPSHHLAGSLTMGHAELSRVEGGEVQRRFESGEWSVVMSMPSDVAMEMRRTHASQYRVAPQLGTYCLAWNVAANLMPQGSPYSGSRYERGQATVRRAISLLVDRQAIVSAVSAGQVPASSLVPPGMRDVGGMEFYANAGGNDGHPGYFDVSAGAREANVAEAVSALRGVYAFDEGESRFGNVPPLRLLYAAGTGVDEIAAQVASDLGAWGISVTPEPLEHESMQSAIATGRPDELHMFLTGWVADYTDPMYFLDMWLPGASDPCRLGKGAHAGAGAYSLDLTSIGYEVSIRSGTWEQTYGRAISLAKGEQDPSRRYALLHKAEDLLMTTGAVCPLYYFAQPYLVGDSIEGFAISPLGTFMLAGATNSARR